MCCSWTIVLDRKQQHDMSCASSANAVLAEHMRQKIRRDLSRWSRKLLLCLGLENIGKHIVGDSKWEKLYDGCPSSSSTTTAEHEQDQDQDFEPQVRENGTPPPIRGGDKSPSNLDRSGVESIQVDVGGGEDDGVEEHQEEAEVEQSENIKEGIEGGNRSEEEGEEMCEKRRQMEEGEEDDEVDVPVKRDMDSSPKNRIDKKEEEEMGEERYKEEDEGEFEDEREGGDVSRQSPLSTPPSNHGPTTRSMVDHREPPDSPLSGSEEAAQSTEEKGPTGEGGALVDNLFQILPYWYFLNRAFGMSGGGPGGAPDAAMMEGVADGEEDDDDGGGSSTADGGGGGQDNGRGSASSPFGGTAGGQQGASSQRLNSLLLLESLRQLQNQGQQGLLTQDQTLQQQLQISELLSRMSGGAGGLGASGIDPRNIPWSGNAASGPPSASEQDTIDDQPLDLTASCRTSRGDHIPPAGFSPPSASHHHHHLRSNNNNNTTASLSPFSHLDEQTSKVFRSNPRSSKGYTAQELQAALHDIQSGKLGTRRAAVIYGIPRSTLRNKVYKLGKDRGRLFNNATAVPNGPSLVSSLHNNNNNNNNNNNKEAATGAGGSTSLLGKLSYFHNLSAVQNSYLSGSGSRGGAPGRFIEDDDGADDTPPQATHSPAFLNRRAPPSLYAMGNGGDVANKHLNTSSSSSSTAHHQSSLSQLISKQRSFHQAYPMDVAMMEESSCHSDDGHPTASVAPPGISHKDSWKFALSRHQEQQQQLLGRQAAVGGANHHQHHHRQSLPQQNSSHGGGDDGSSSSLDLAGKKSRPKRGKYRNYDREALVKAVRAVQNGEMSVHRAGSFFGVPHSTLEYKVKERHLLRRPKRKEVTSPLSQPKSTSSPESTSQDAAPGSRQHTSAFAKAAAPSSKSILNNNNNNSGGGGESGGLSSHHPYLFPLTSDLRESLSRYLNQENNNKSNNDDEDRASSGEIMDTGSAGQHEENEDEDEIEEHHHPRLHLLAASGGGKRGGGSGSGEGGGPTALALEGLIGNRLSNLFQLNDILLRTGSGGGGGAGGGGGEGRPENLLDLSKK